MWFENTGHQRTVGRLLGYCLLAGEPKSLDDIATDLLVSKATASLTVRQGLLMGIVEKIGIPGDRRAYFRVDVRSWIENSQLFQSPFAEWEKIIDKALALVKPEQHTAIENLILMRDFFKLMERHFSDLLEQYKRKLRENTGPVEGEQPSDG